MPDQQPYAPDNVPKNGATYARGTKGWIKLALKQGKDGPLVAPASDFHLQPSIVTLTDPDNGALNWGTNDQFDVDDTYTAAHPDYTGVPGLFAEGFSTTMTGRLAFKIDIPVGAEVTYLDNLRNYLAQWQVKLQSGNTTDPNDFAENFNVTPEVTAQFSDVVITPAAVTAGINTGLDNDTITTLIEEATCEAKGYAEDCGIDTAGWQNTLDPTVKSAIISYSRGLIFTYDQSAHNKAARIREGDTSIQFSGIAGHDTLTRLYFKQFEDKMERYCRRNGTMRRARLGVVSHGPSHRASQRSLMEGL